MAYPRRLLAEDEHVVRELRQHWRQLVLPVALLLVLVPASTYLVAALGPTDWGPARWVVLVAAVAAVARWVVLPWLRWLTTTYVVTNQRLVVRRGVLLRRGRDLPLDRVASVTYERTLLERALGSGTLVVEPLSGEAVVLRHVPDVEAVQRDVHAPDEDEAYEAGGWDDEAGGWDDEAGGWDDEADDDGPDAEPAGRLGRRRRGGRR